MAGPARGRRRRATSSARFCLPCADRLRSGPGASPKPDAPTCSSPVQRLHLAAGSAAAQDRRQRPSTRPVMTPTTRRLVRRDTDMPAPSRIGQIPSYGLPAASGAADIGLRLAQSYAQEAEILSGPGEAEAAGGPRQSRRRRLQRTRRCGFRFRRRNPPTRRRSRPRWPARSPGQPPRKRLKIDDDPFGAVGDYAGSFLIKSALELSRRLRHQSRPHRDP